MRVLPRANHRSLHGAGTRRRLGPAPAHDYHTSMHPFSWRGWWDFGTGALGDMGCHILSFPFMALKLGAPSAVSAETDQPVNNVSPPQWLPGNV